MRSALCGHRSQNVISELDGLARDLNEVCSTLEYAVFVPLDAVVVGSVAQSCLTLCDPMDCSVVVCCVVSVFFVQTCNAPFTMKN